MIRPRRVRLRHHVLGLTTLALAVQALAACGPKRPVETGKGEDQCPADLRAGGHGLMAPPPFEPPRSHVALDLTVASERIQREIGRRVPTILDQGQRDIGAPGRVTYQVTRGPFSLGLKDDRLVATTDIQAQAEVCKDFGPVCVTYGRCSPALTAVASLPLLPGPSFTLGPSEVSVSVRRGCSIAGFDVTPRIEELGRQEAASAKKRIDRSLPRLDELARRAWSYGVMPIALGEGRCLIVEHASPRVTRPRLEQGVFSVRMGIDLDLRWSDACAPPAGNSSPESLPALQVAADLAPETRLHLVFTTPWDQIRAQVSGALGVESGSNASEELRVQPALVGNARRVAIGLRRRGDRCGGMWLFAEPWFDATSGEVRLRRFERATGGDGAADQFAQYSRALAQGVHLGIGLQPDDVRQRIQDLRSRLVAEIADQAELGLSLEGPEVESVVPAAQGLVTVLTLRARVALTVQ